MGAIVMFQPVKPKTPTQNCSKCFSSMFRKIKGVTVLYCGYYYRAVPIDGCCMAFTNSDKR